MKRYLRLAALFVLAIAIGGFLFAVLCGGGVLFDFFKVILALWAFLWLPGACVYRGLKLKDSLSCFSFPAIVALGTGCFVVCISCGFRWNLVSLCTLPLLVLSAAEVACQIREKRAIKVTVSSGHLFLFSGLLLVTTLCWVLANGHPAVLGSNALKQDFLWTVGNTRSFSLGFPPQDIRYAGIRLTYHYLNELLTASISAITGVSAYNLLAFVLPPVWIALGLACLSSLATLIHENQCPSAWTPVLIYGTSGVGALALLFGVRRQFSAGMLYHLVTNINACGTALVFFCCFCGLAVVLLRENFHCNMWIWIITLGIFLLMLFAKGPIAAILALAFTATVIVRFFQHRTSWRDFLFAALLLSMFFLVYRFLFSAGANNMEIGLANTLLKMDVAPLLLSAEKAGQVIYYVSLPFLYLLCVFLLNPLLTGLYLAAVTHDICHLKTLSGERLFLHAAAAGGLIAFFLFDHYALSQIYFLFLAFWCMACLAPTLQNLTRHNGTKIVIGILAVVSLSGSFYDVARLASAGIPYVGETRTAEHAPAQIKMTREDEEAMLWLATHMPPDEVFATNRYHTGSPLAGNSNLYTAFSGRQAYMEGFRYTISNMGVSEQAVEKRFINNAILFSPKSNIETIRALAVAENIQWLVFSCQLGTEPAAFTQLDQVFANELIHIYRL